MYVRRYILSLLFLFFSLLTTTSTRHQSQPNFFHQKVTEKIEEEEEHYKQKEGGVVLGLLNQLNQAQTIPDNDDSPFRTGSAGDYSLRRTHNQSPVCPLIPLREKVLSQLAAVEAVSPGSRGGEVKGYVCRFTCTYSKGLSFSRSLLYIFYIEKKKKEKGNLEISELIIYFFSGFENSALRVFGRTPPTRILYIL